MSLHPSVDTEKAIEMFHVDRCMGFTIPFSNYTVYDDRGSEWLNQTGREL